ncbi:MAG: PH domain-containing protein, partial [Mycobacterium sp.]
MQQTQWAPPAAGIAGCGIAGIVMATACVTLVTDAPGRLLTGIAAVGLILFASATW